jgi:antitoxin Phd
MTKILVRLSQGIVMNNETHWPVQDAKARFSEFLSACLTNGPQVVTKHGAQTAVLVSLDEWQRLSENRPPNLKELLLADAPRAELETPNRQGHRRRAAPSFE